MSTDDAYRQWDAAYVLGALSAAERREFEDHLAGCADCRTAVADLAAMPGLLARFPAEEALSLSDRGRDAPHPPASLMPDLRAEPAPEQPRTQVQPLAHRRTPWYAVAAAALLLALGGLAGWFLHTDRVVTSASADRLAFSSVVPSNMTAVVDVVPSSTGTEFRVECQYARGTGGDAGSKGAWETYAIYVVDKAGHATLTKTWKAAPDKVMHPSGSTPLQPSQVSAVEIRSVDSGQTIMRAAVG